MSLKKHQLVATAKVSGKYKVCWLFWWNMKKESGLEYNFTASLCSDVVLRVLVVRALFWAGVRFTFKFTQMLDFIYNIVLFLLLRFLTSFVIILVAPGGGCR